MSEELPRTPGRILSTLICTPWYASPYNAGMRSLVLLLAFPFLFLSGAGPAFAWPTKPVTFIVPYPPGGKPTMKRIGFTG